MIRALTLLCILGMSNATYADAKDMISEATKSAISFGKDMLKGLNDGVDEGRKDAEGVDGAVTVTNVEELEQYVKVEVIEVFGEDAQTHVTLGFKNQETKPVRIANMDDHRIVLLIDSEGYSQEQSDRSRRQSEFTIPANTGKKHTFMFNIGVDKADKIRLWSKDYDLKGHFREEPQEDGLMQVDA